MIQGSAVSMVLPVLLVASCWMPPVDGPIVEPFRAPPCAFCPGRRGVEFGIGAGVEVRAVAAGEVTFAGSVAGTRYVVVRHADGRRATYGQLDSAAVERGHVIGAGTVVGMASGRLYFGLREADELGGAYLDPSPFLGRLVHRPRLVPTDGSPGRPGHPPRLTCPPGAPGRSNR
jgi:murein DD-endopeptidase MepM/ murein hydrolase activator NlpD